MQVTVRAFGQLREQMGLGERRFELAANATVADAWYAFTHFDGPPAHIQAAVNHERMGTDTALSDGDEVAFFPPVTGG